MEKVDIRDPSKYLEPMPAFIQWLHSPGRLPGEVVYLHHASGIVHLGSNDDREVVMSRAMEEEFIQIILHPIQDTDLDGNCKWLLKVHADHMCYIRFR